MKRLLLAIPDFLLTLTLFFLSVFVLILTIVINRLRLNPPDLKAEKKLLTFTTGSHEDNSKRNLERVYEHCLLNGYFSKCIFVYYLAETPKVYQFGKQIEVFDFRSQGAARWKKWGFPAFASLCQEIVLLYFCYQLIRKEKISHMQANDPYIQGTHALILSWLTKVPYVAHAVCNYEYYYREFGRLAFSIFKFRKVERILEWFVWRFSDGIWALCENYLQYAVDSGGNRKKAVIATTFMDERYFEENPGKENHAFPFSLQDHPVMIYLGRISWDKYCLDLIDCMEVISRKNPLARLVILGDGEKRQEFEARLAGKKLSDHVYIAGFASVPLILAWADHAKLMLATHAGYALLEMGARAIPAVAYNFDTPADMIHDGENGFLVPLRDARAMAEKALLLLENPNLSLKLGKNMKTFVFQEHHPEVVKKKLKKLFQWVLEKKWNPDAKLESMKD